MRIDIPYLNNTPICVAKTATHGLRKDECCITTDIQPLLYKSENTGSPDKRMSFRNVIQHFYSIKFLYLKATNRMNKSHIIKLVLDGSRYYNFVNIENKRFGG